MIMSIGISKNNHIVNGICKNQWPCMCISKNIGTCMVTSKNLQVYSDKGIGITPLQVLLMISPNIGSMLFDTSFH